MCRERMQGVESHALQVAVLGTLSVAVEEFMREGILVKTPVELLVRLCSSLFSSL